MIKTALAVLAMTVVVLATPEFHRVRVHHKSMFADEDVLLDIDANYAMGTVGHMNGSGSPSINFHDLETGYSAVKDVTKGQCFIQQSNHTMNEFRNKIQQIILNAEKEHIEEYYWTCERQSIPSGMLKALFGERIASFCKNYESLFVSRTHAAPEMATRSVSNQNGYWCFICFTINGAAEMRC